MFAVSKKWLESFRQGELSEIDNTEIAMDRSDYIGELPFIK